MSTRVCAAYRIVLASSVLALLACATPEGTVGVVAVGNIARNTAPSRSAPWMTVQLPLHAAAPGAAGGAAAAAVPVQLLPFDDGRKDIDVDGTTTAALAVPMARVRFEPSPVTMLGQVVRAELQAAGHRVTEQAQHVQMAGTVLAFDVATETTLLYWDVIGNLAVALQPAAARGTGAAASLGYQARCADRTYVWPTQAVIAAVVRRCIDDFAEQLRRDERMPSALRAVAAQAMSEPAAPTPRPDDAQAGADMRTHVGRDRRWSVAYPSSWSLDEGAGFVRIRQQAAVLGIHAVAAEAGLSLDAVADAQMLAWERQMRQVNTVRRVSRKHLVLAGGRMAIAIEHDIGDGAQGRTRKIITRDKDRVFLIDTETYRVNWPLAEPAFNRIIDTFRILD